MIRYLKEQQKEMPEFKSWLNCKCSPKKELCSLCECTISYWYLTDNEIDEVSSLVNDLIAAKVANEHKGFRRFFPYLNWAYFNSIKIDKNLVEKLVSEILNHKYKNILSWTNDNVNFTEFCKLKTYTKSMSKLLQNKKVSFLFT